MEYKPKTELQLKADARNHLYRQLYGLGLERFYKDAVFHKALTDEEAFIVKDILDKIEYLKNNKFKNTKLVGLKAKRRCSFCKKVAYFRVVNFGNFEYLCKKHKEEFEQDALNHYNKDNDNKQFIVYSINPNE